MKRSYLLALHLHLWCGKLPNRKKRAVPLVEHGPSIDTDQARGSSAGACRPRQRSDWLSAVRGSCRSLTHLTASGLNLKGPEDLPQPMCHVGDPGLREYAKKNWSRGEDLNL